jgi:putative ABC transport system permease protein
MACILKYGVKIEIMLSHYFKITFRHIRKSLLISILNISGLAIGIACFMFIMLYVNHELNYDRQHVHYDDIYRVAIDLKTGNTVNRLTWTPAPLPEALYEEYPEVKAVSRIYDRPFTVKVDKLSYNEKRSAAVDSSFTDIFTLNFVEGSPGKVLNEPGQVLLDLSTARKYFGDKPAFGQVIVIRDTIPLTVMGVYEDFPPQTHFHFNMLVSLVSIEGEYNRATWDAYNFKTYLRLESGFDEEVLESKFPGFIDKYMPGEYNDVESGGDYRKLYLQHIREIHLGSDLNMEFEPNGNLNYIRIFSIVAFLVLVVACINFMNLTTASSTIRVKEIGIRKTSGASKQKLKQQFFVEAIVISILSMILAMGLVESLMGSYQNLAGREIEMNYKENLLIVPGMLGLAILVGLLSGSYPALYMSRFSVIDSLGYKGIKQSKSWFRNVLVLFQFSVAIFLIAAAMLVQRQMDLILEKSLGFDKEDVILVKNAGDLGENLETFMDDLRQFPEIEQVSTSTHIPGDKFIIWGFNAQGVEETFNLNANLVDESYLETLGMEMAKGRFLSREYGADVQKIILNETAVKVLGFEDPIGKTINMWFDTTSPYEIIGVIKDYHWESKQQTIKPHILINREAVAWAPRYLSVKTGSKNHEKMIKLLEEKWSSQVPDVPFEYEFLDQHYDGIYQNEKKTKSLLIVFAIIAIFISCLGLFGLASFMAARRTKEIGIRKANGASTQSILRLLSLDFTRWVLLANIIAWPFIWVALKNWLESFAYRVELQLWIFAVAGFLTFVIALATISYHAIHASRQNPGLLFRYE